MNLYLIRHGDAETDKPDEERSLTPSGVEAVKKTAQWVTKATESPAILLSSPLKRAQETAGYFAKGWNVGIETVEWLHADVDPSVVIEALKKRREQSIALVGHLPNLGLLMGVLLCGLPPKEIMLPKGSIAYLTMKTPEPASARLKWLITPEII